MNLAQIEYFATTAETLNFTKTADVLSVTQQAVSKGIASLEGELGVRLFERGPAGLALTEEGRRAWHHAEGILHDAAKLAGSVRSAGSEPRVIRLGVSDVLLGNRYTLSLADVLAFEGAEGDGAKIDISESTSDGCQDMLAAGGVDVIMITGRADYRRFRVRRLEERPFVPFVGLPHRLAGERDERVVEPLVGRSEPRDRRERRVVLVEAARQDAPVGAGEVGRPGRRRGTRPLGCQGHRERGRAGGEQKRADGSQHAERGARRARWSPPVRARCFWARAARASRRW